MEERDSNNGVILVDSTIVIDTQGKVSYRSEGPTGYEKLARAVRKAM